MDLKKWIFLCAALFVSQHVLPAQSKTRPVVVIPGIMGSKLCDQSGKVVWGDRASYTASRINALRLPFDINARDRGIHSCGLIEQISIIPLLWESNVYARLLTFLKEQGYGEKEIVTFDYDWRLSNFENAKLLSSKIEALQTGSEKVDIVAHSMGGLVARIYIQKYGGSAKVQNLIMIGTPHRGSAKVFQRLKEGFENWPNALSGGLPEIQKTVLSFPSTFQLLPMYSECCGFSSDANPVTAQYADILDPAIWTKFSWLPDEFKTGPGAASLGANLNEARSLKDLLLQPISNDPEAVSRTRFIANGFLDTWSRVFFNPSNGQIVGHTASPGDGTVLLFSATNGVPAQVQVGLREHETVFAGKEPELVMTATLSDRQWTAGRVEFSQTASDAHGEKFVLRSAALELSAVVVSPTQEMEAKITFRGGEDLKNADLSNMRLELLSNDAVTASFSPNQKKSGDDPAVLTIAAKFNAPQDPGPYQVRFSLPGLETLSTEFAVLVP